MMPASVLKLPSPLQKEKDVEVFNAIGRANVDAKAGDAAYAIEKLNLATQVKGFKDPETYIIMGDAYRKLIDGGNAVTSYTKALGLDPKLAAAHPQDRQGVSYKWESPGCRMAA